MTDQMSFNCPHCQVGLQAPFDAIGRDVQCNKCGKRFIVPAQFEFDAPQPAKAAPRPATTATTKPGAPSPANRPATGPVFVKPEPKAKPQVSAASKITAQASHIASLLALPVIALAVLGGGAWWFFSGDDSSESDAAATEQPAPSTTETTAAADAAAAAEVASLKAEQERKDKEAVDKKYAEALAKAAKEVGLPKDVATTAAAP